MSYTENYEKWRSDGRLCEEGRAELQKIAGDEKEKEYRFGGELEFGTAGMRGIIGCGKNMMNVRTVMRASQGLAEYVKTLGGAAMARGGVISYDTRRNSRLFAEKSAQVLAKNGIKAYLFNEVHPVPMLSYAVRYLNTVAGVMITASHHPSDRNGLKFFTKSGGIDSADLEKIIA